MKTLAALFIAVLGFAAIGVVGYKAISMTPEQIEQQRIQTERERVQKEEAAERERIRQSYLRKEAAFGSMIMAHTRNYREVREKASKNGMFTTDGLRDKRDAEAMAWFKAANFRFEKWEAKIVKIDGPAEMQCPKAITPCINLDVKMTTPDGLILHASAPKSSQFVTTLTASKVGDVLVISGKFVSAVANSIFKDDRDGLTPTSPRAMEVSITDAGSMDDPEYRIVIDSMYVKDERL